MGTKCRHVDRGTDRGVDLIRRAGRETREARVDRGLSLRAVGGAVGLSESQVSRIERGLVARVSVIDLARLHAVVGLELSLKSYPSGQPIRDAAHVALLEDFRAHLHRTLTWSVEVPIPLPGDRRSWDALINGPVGGTALRPRRPLETRSRSLAEPSSSSGTPTWTASCWSCNGPFRRDDSLRKRRGICERRSRSRVYVPWNCSMQASIRVAVQSSFCRLGLADSNVHLVDLPQRQVPIHQGLTDRLTRAISCENGNPTVRDAEFTVASCRGGNLWSTSWAPDSLACGLGKAPTGSCGPRKEGHLASEARFSQ